MSEKIDDGGPAFPTLDSLVNNSGTRTQRFDAQLVGGMSLRDWFAGQALAHPHDMQIVNRCAHDWMCSPSIALVHICYDWADAMIAERKRR